MDRSTIPGGTTLSRLSHYLPLCEKSLRKAFNPRTSLFDRQLRHGQWSTTLGTEAITSTCIVLIGAHRARLPLPSDTTASDLLAAAATEVAKTRYLGGGGLLLWAASLWSPGDGGSLLTDAGIPLTRLASELSPMTTMEVAWWVSGLLHARQHPQENSVSDHALTHLTERFAESAGVMHHATRHAPWKQRIRRHVANFADQIYSVQALALAAIAGVDQGRALSIANRVAQRITEHQGGLGQWWWHYDSRRGEVAQHYPVYSVHQHGMAPMALHTLHRAGGADLRDAASRGTDWLDDNELHRSMIDDHASTVWRSVERQGGLLGKWEGRARSILGAAPRHPESPLFELNRETRPYEWAWLLYSEAIGDDSATPPPGHLV